MDFITHFFQALRSPRTAAVLFLFTGALLFIPLDRFGLKQPEFTEAYQTQILLVFLFAAAILTLEFVTGGISMVRAPFKKRAHKKAYMESIEKTFKSLNLKELCVLWAMTQDGTKTIQASYDNPVMVSLRQKNALSLIPGLQSFHETNHCMPDALYDLVAERGYEHMPQNFRNSDSFHAKVKEIVQNSTTWRSWS